MVTDKIETLALADTVTLDVADPFSKAEIDARVVRQRSVLARIRDLDDATVDVVTHRIADALDAGQGREDLVAGLYLVAHRDDLYDALAQQRQAEILTESPAKAEHDHFVQGIVRIGYVPQTTVAAVETMLEAAIASGETRGSAYEIFLLWAGACRHRWLWNIVQSAHRHSLLSRGSCTP